MMGGVFPYLLQCLSESLVLDATKDDQKRMFLTKELEDVGIRCKCLLAPKYWPGAAKKRK